MPAVVDASAIAAIVFGEPEGQALVDHLDGETLLAPKLLDLELTSIALKKMKRYPDQRGEIISALHAGLMMRIDRRDVPGGEVLELAWNSGLTAYDAAYLWLSRAHDAELVSLDKSLMQ